MLPEMYEASLKEILGKILHTWKVSYISASVNDSLVTRNFEAMRLRLMKTMSRHRIHIFEVYLLLDNYILIKIAYRLQ